jgi:predicted enzyme related to lactoylglutathione lyase
VSDTGRIVWHNLLTTNVEQARQFYADLTGWDGSLHGGVVEGPEGMPPSWLAYVRVDDADSAAERATLAGGRIVTGPDDIPEVGCYVVIADPAGAVIAGFASDGDVAPEGTFVWDELLTTDVEGARSFYGDVFGWTSGQLPEATSTYYAFRSDETSRAGLMQKPEEVPSPLWQTFLATDDVDAGVQKARGLGAEIHVEGTDVPNIGRFAVLADPQGAVVGLLQFQS